MKKYGIAVLFATFVAAPAMAQLTWYSDQASFTAANAGNILMGIEDYEASILPANAIVGFDDPLQFGVPNGPNGFPYPNGTQGLASLTTQSNNLGNAGFTTSPTGVNGLAAGSVGFLGFTSDGVISNFRSHGMDLIFTGGHVSVGGRVVDALGPQTGVEIMVFDINNNLLGQMHVSGNARGSFFTGVSSAGALIGRLNLFSAGSEGMDDVQGYNVPGPASFSLFVLGGLALVRRRR